MTITEEQRNTIESTTTQGPKSAWAAVLDTYRDRRAERSALKAVERELATYTSPADLQDLDSMLERCADANEVVYGPIIERVRFRAA